MRVPSFKVFGLQGRKEWKKKNPDALVQILSSLYFLPIWEERKMLALWRTLHFPFPRSVSLQTNKGFFFSFLLLLSLAFPLVLLIASVTYKVCVKIRLLTATQSTHSNGAKKLKSYFQHHKLQILGYSSGAISKKFSS